MSHPKGVMPEHLKEFAWKKGQSGNPKGSKPRESFESLVRRVLDEKLTLDDGRKIEKREAIARVFVDEMMRRNTTLLRELLAREWPVRQVLDVSASLEVSRVEAREALASRMAVIGGRVNGETEAPELPDGRGGNGASS